VFTGVEYVENHEMKFEKGQRLLRNSKIAEICENDSKRRVGFKTANFNPRRGMFLVFVGDQGC